MPAVVFRPDGRQFAAFPKNGQIQFWSADSGGQVGGPADDGHHRLILEPRRPIAGGDERRRPVIYLWDVPNRQQVGVLEGHKNLAVRATFSPAGDLVASNGWEGMLRLWDPRTGRHLLSMPTTDWPKFNRQGDRLLTMSGGVPQLWQVADGREYRTFVADPIRGQQVKQVPYGTSISPDGRFLAAGSEDGTVIWELATGNELAHLPTGLTWHVLFQPSGDLLTSGANWTDALAASTQPQCRRRVSPRPAGATRRRQHRRGGAEQGRPPGHRGRVGVGGQVIDFDHPGARRALFSHSGHQQSSRQSRRRSGRPPAATTGRGSRSGRCPRTAGSATCPSKVRRCRCSVRTAAGWQPRAAAACNCGRSAPGSAVRRYPRASRCFCPTARCSACAAKSTVTFLDPDTGRTIATLEDPNQDRAGYGCFNSDGALLALPTEESYSVHVWDLRRIRAGLKDIDLDWEAPEYPPAPPPFAPVRIKILDGQPEKPPEPPVVVLNAAAKRRSATPEQIAGWIKQLADKDTKTQDEAEKALEEVGAPALPALGQPWRTSMPACASASSASWIESRWPTP